MTRAITDQTVDIIYNLYEATPGLYLPVAFIVSRDKNGYFAHIQQKANAATIGAFNLELTPVRNRMFDLIEELQIKNIETHFKLPRRKVKPLADLMADREVKPTVIKYVHRRLNEILQAALKHDFPLSWDVERKVLVNDFVIQMVQEPLEAILSFQKTEKDVRYQLKLREGADTWLVSSKEVAAVVNHPSWVFADYKMYRIRHLNGNLVLPFRQRDEVVIPADKVAVYFKKFILKVAAKVEIEAQGFVVDQLSGLQTCRLQAVRHLFEDRWVLAVQMEYPRASFGWNEDRQQKTQLDMQEDDIHIFQVKREPAAERVYIERLYDMGLQVCEGSSYFELAFAKKDHTPFLSWLAEQRSLLEENGFVLDPIETENGPVYLHVPKLSFSQKNENDWLDIHGLVQVGDFEFPFLDLVKNIKNNDPDFILPNGAVFLIPEEWMSRYRDLIQFGKMNGKSLRLAKSQYPILEELGLAVEEIEALDAATEYVPNTDLKATLRPYQLDGVRWLVQHHYNQLGACLADDMGLGKTLQTIAVLLFAKAKKDHSQNGNATQNTGQISLFAADADSLRPLNALIVLPASLVYNWAEELSKFAPSLSVNTHTGPRRQKDARILSRFDVILTTYQTALRDVELLQKISFEYIVLDESQQIKNRESKVFRALNKLESRHKISLSGTPIENSLSDLWSQMHFINPDLLGSFRFFRQEFQHPIEKLADEAKKNKLRKLVHPYLLRRTKQEVASDLPELVKQTVYVEMTSEQKKLYEREKSAARNYLLDNFAAQDGKYRILVIQTLTKLRQLANHPVLIRPEYEKGSGKFTDVFEQWEVIRKGGHKALFFSSFVKYLELFRTELSARGQASAWLTGQLNASQRKAEIQRFQNEPDVQAFLISIKSGGTGLNLTAADYVFILDPWWNPTTEDQAIARAHRIGQHKKVFAKKFITRGSIEEKIKALQERKSKLAEDILGGSGKMALDKGEIEFLLS